MELSFGTVVATGISMDSQTSVTTVPLGGFSPSKRRLGAGPLFLG